MADNGLSKINTDFERLLSCHPESQRRVYRVGRRDASLRLSMTGLDLSVDEELSKSFEP